MNPNVPSSVNGSGTTKPTLKYIYLFGGLVDATIGGDVKYSFYLNHENGANREETSGF